LKRVKSVLDSYDLNGLTIGTICSHSALQILFGARVEGSRRGHSQADRKPVYDAYAAATPDHYIEVSDWAEILSRECSRN